MAARDATVVVQPQPDENVAAERFVASVAEREQARAGAGQIDHDEENCGQRIDAKMRYLRCRHE